MYDVEEQKKERNVSGGEEVGGHESDLPVAADLDFINELQGSFLAAS